MNEFDLQHLIEGSVLLIDKPVSWTSFDVVNKIRSAIRHRANIKKIKVGHTGTLDPFATGLLIICTGKMTKKIQSFMELTKQYQAIYEFGKESDSYDVTGSFLKEEDITEMPLDRIKHVIQKQFIGRIEQIPPMFSAKKVNGQRLYKLARKGKTVERQKRAIQIDQYDVINYQHPEIEVLITCSKGTYIRSLAHDLGQALNTIAYCKTLKRTAIGKYHLNQALTLENWLAQFDLNNAVVKN